MTDPSPTIPGASPTATRIAGLAAIAAPLLMLASSLAYITQGNGINDGVSGGTIGVLSSFAFVLALVGVYRALEPVAPRAAPIMMVVAVIGAAAGIAFNVDAILAYEIGREEIDALTEESAVALLAFLPWGLFFPIGLVGTGILIWRTRRFARPLAGLVAAGGVLFVASRPERIDVLAVIGDCALILGFVPIGWSLLTSRRPATITSSAPAPA